MAPLLLAVLAALYGGHLQASEVFPPEAYDVDDTGEVDEDIIIDEEDPHGDEGVNDCAPATTKVGCLAPNFRGYWVL